jgi:hypothetical protein
MKTKQFDYYIFIDYSDNFIGYNIIASNKINELLPKISRFRHYRASGNKKLYIKNIKGTFKREKLLNSFIKTKVRESRENLEIFSDVAEFLKTNSNCLIFISVDDKQYSNFEKLVRIIDGNNIKIIKESQLKVGTPEYQISLILDNWLNIERLSKNKGK